MLFLNHKLRGGNHCSQGASVAERLAGVNIAPKSLRGHSRRQRRRHDNVRAIKLQLDYAEALARFTAPPVTGRGALILPARSKQCYRASPQRCEGLHVANIANGLQCSFCSFGKISARVIRRTLSPPHTAIRPANNCCCPACVKSNMATTRSVGFG